ncbi:uncharacterized protein LOC106656777 [Trichogramma pretiosum]|uniref:uncharacterized protein LOC106656777 n=1 Tax=Trichogramma pretiosum TaxID=7493 RepID=UPI000C71B965|nr:uncharacterized protein LOC106656777 [Trichogramma pretiosum]
MAGSGRIWSKWRRAACIQAVRSNNLDPTWEPKNHRICNQHFIGNLKSEDPRSPSFNPTLFPRFKKISILPEAAIERYNRLINRNKTRNHSTAAQITNESQIKTLSEIDLDLNTDNVEHVPIPVADDTSILKKDVMTQVEPEELLSDESSSAVTHNIILCNLKSTVIDGKINCEAQTQCSESTDSSSKSDAKITEKSIDSFLELFDVFGIRGFKGYDGLNEESLEYITGVSLGVFKLLLKVILKCKRGRFFDNNKKCISQENKLLIFLVKMKTGMTFSAISSFFGIHRTTASTIFYKLLEFLVIACKEFVPWPTQDEVRGTTPDCFKPDYSNCRIIIDATEFRIEQPPHIDQQIQTWSHYKSGYKIKYVIGCMLGGLITFMSDGYGGRASDVQITAASKLMQLLESVMPPFVQNHHLDEVQREEQRNIARVRIHIERIMQRIRLYKVVDHFTNKMLPHADSIVFMCCVLVNLQPPIIKAEFYNQLY